MNITTPFLLIVLGVLSGLFFFRSHGEKNIPTYISSKDGPATHNMLVVGEKTIFLSHLPMFQEKGERPMPHRYQAILEVSFEKTGASPQDVYFKDRKSHPGIKIYTINPENFMLPALVASDTLRHFKGTIFRGHLEKLQKTEGEILKNINVTVKRVVHFREFNPAMKKPAQLEYLLFGKGSELFLAHFITGPPDFDQVLAVQISGHTFNDEELAKGIKLTFSGTANTPAGRLKEAQQKDAEHKPDSASSPQKLRVLVKRELYFEEGELRVPAVFNTTAEEKKAAFF